MGSDTRVPRLIVILALLVILVTTIAMFLGGFRVGATWDERAHVHFLQTYFDTGWNVGLGWLVDGELDPFTGKWPYFVYGPVTSLLAHGAAVIAGQEAWGDSSFTAGAYAARHVAIGLIALLGVAAVGGIVRLITRSWSWSVVGAALLASTPMWMGHGMFNVKDLPVGTGYTLATLGFVAILRVGYARRPWLRLLAWLSIVSGLVLAAGTRPAAGLGIALAGIGIAGLSMLVFLLSRRNARWSRLYSRARILDSVGPLFASYLVLLAIYPKAFIDPFRLVKETLLISGRFPVNDPELTFGVWLSQPPPWFYLPVWFGAQSTLLVLAGCILFAGTWLLVLVQVFRSRFGDRDLVERALLPAPVVSQALLMATLAVLAQSTIYDAMRQFLFIPPAAAALAAIGIRAGIRLLKERHILRSIAWSLVGVGLVLPVIDQLRLFPYGYAYYNELASVRPINGNWATDYWRASGRELVRLIPNGETSCIFVDPETPPRPCDEDASFAPFWSEQGSEARPGILGPSEYWLVRENGGDVAVPPNCSEHDRITRPLRNQTLVIAQVMKCAYPETP